MAAQNQIVERLKRQKNQITGMVTPWLHSMAEHKQSQGHTSPVNLPAGIRFRAMGRKMRTLDENRLGSIRPDMVFQLGKRITQRAESTQDLMHFSPTVTREPGIWSEMEQVLPAAQPREASTPAEPGVLRQGSVIERMSMFPKPGQSISTFKQQMASAQPGPAEPVERPAPRPRIKPGNRMYTRVQEVVQPKGQQPAAPAESAPAPAAPAAGEAKAPPSRETRPAPPSNTVQRAVDHDEPPARSAPPAPARQEPPHDQPKRQPDVPPLPLAELPSRPATEAKPVIGPTEPVREQPKAAAPPEVSKKPAPAAEHKTDLPRAKAAPVSPRLPDLPRHGEPLKSAVPARHAAPPLQSRPAPVPLPARPPKSTTRPEPARVQPKVESTSRPAIPRVFASISRRAQPAAETARPPRIAPKPAAPPAQTIQRQLTDFPAPEESAPAEPIQTVEQPAAQAKALPEAKPAPLTEAAPRAQQADTHLPLAALPARRPADPQNPLRETLARRALPARQQTQTLRQGDLRPKIAPLVDASRQPLVSPKKYQRSDSIPGEPPAVSPQPRATVPPAVSEIDAHITRLRQEQGLLPPAPSADQRPVEPAAQSIRGHHPAGQPASFVRTAMPLATSTAPKRQAQTPVLQNSSAASAEAAPAEKPSTPTMMQPARPPDRAVTPAAVAGAASMVVQRELTDTVSNALQQPQQLLGQQAAQQESGTDLEKLAEEVFPIVKRLIEIEMERLSGGF